MKYTLTTLFPFAISDARVSELIAKCGLTRSGEITFKSPTEIVVEIQQDLSEMQIAALQSTLVTNELLPKLLVITKS